MPDSSHFPFSALSYFIAPQIAVEYWQKKSNKETRVMSSSDDFSGRGELWFLVKWEVGIIGYNYPCSFNPYLLCYRNAGLALQLQGFSTQTSFSTGQHKLQGWARSQRPCGCSEPQGRVPEEPLRAGETPPRQPGSTLPPWGHATLEKAQRSTGGLLSLPLHA